MWLADQWKDYEVIDCSQGEKLERWGDYLLVRPDPRSSGILLKSTGDGAIPTATITAAAREADSGNFLTFPISGPSPTKGSPLT